MNNQKTLRLAQAGHLHAGFGETVTRRPGTGHALPRRLPLSAGVYRPTLPDPIDPIDPMDRMDRMDSMDRTHRVRCAHSAHGKYATRRTQFPLIYRGDPNEHPSTSEIHTSRAPHHAA